MCFNNIYTEWQLVSTRSACHVQKCLVVVSLIVQCSKYWYMYIYLQLCYSLLHYCSLNPYSPWLYLFFTSFPGADSCCMWINGFPPNFHSGEYYICAIHVPVGLLLMLKVQLLAASICGASRLFHNDYSPLTLWNNVMQLFLHRSIILMYNLGKRYYYWDASEQYLYM